MKKQLLSIFAIVLIINALAQIPTNGLIAHYPFNNNANDNSGNGNNGYVNGATLVVNRFGNSNSAYSFTATTNTTNYISVANSNSFNTEMWSVSAWYKTTATGLITRITTKQDVSISHTNYMSILMLNGIVYGSSWNGSSEITASDVSTTNDGNWHNVIYIRDTAVNKYFLYVDGVLKATTNDSFTNLANSDSLFIGSNYNWTTYNQTWNGSLDDIRIYNRVLDSNEVNSIYNEGICLAYTSVTDTLIINTGTITDYNPITYSNNIKVYPNPSNTQVTVDYGNYNSLNGYTLKITNTLSQTIYTTAITQQQSVISLSSFGGNGIYFINLVNQTGQTIDIKKIVLQ